MNFETLWILKPCEFWNPVNFETLWILKPYKYANPRAYKEKYEMV